MRPARAYSWSGLSTELCSRAVVRTWQPVSTLARNPRIRRFRESVAFWVKTTCSGGPAARRRESASRARVTESSPWVPVVLPDPKGGRARDCRTASSTSGGFGQLVAALFR